MNKIEIASEMMSENRKENKSSRIRKTDSFQTLGSLADRVMFLQRTIGNQAVERMIMSGTLQTKLSVNKPGDEYEQEADRVTDQVMRAPEQKIVGSNVFKVHRVCLMCEENDSKRQTNKEEEKEEQEKKYVQKEVFRAADTAGLSSGSTGTIGPAVPQPVGGAAPGGPGGAGTACPTPAEQTQKDNFRRRRDLHVNDNIPSTGIGKFNAKYFPANGMMPVTVKIHFNFVNADNTPGFIDQMRRRLRGENLDRFFWTQAEKRQYADDFVTRVQERWSNQHTMRATKPCWTEFFAIPFVTPQTTEDVAGAHYNVTVHKSSGPGIDYKSAVHNENLLNPAAQPTADMWSSDITQSPNFRSTQIATQERQRIESALMATAATPVLFGRNRAIVDNAVKSSLRTFAAALNQANPSAPLIPIDLAGSASSGGNPAHNMTLSQQRADSVRAVLQSAGIRQPVRSVGTGQTGAPNDPANRKVNISVDHVFETTYASNRYSVSEHEFGHMIGLPDEYSNAGPPGPTLAANPLGNVQANYSGLLTTAGLTVPTFGQDTSSQMSAGVDVLPRHYLTLWEALGRMTTPDLMQGDWSIL